MTACIRPLDPTELLPFLILRQAAGCKQAALARHLLEHGSVSAAARASPWPTLEYHVYAAQRQCVALQTLGLHTVPVYSLPSFLRAARPLPAALFVRGNLQLLAQLGLAIVGSRRASDSAVRWAQSQAFSWASRGRAGGEGLIISGGAHGIDAAAHAGALQAGGTTAAYLGSPIDSPYPATNKPLFARMLAQGGALISEHPPYSATHAYHHAARNRFIAAHCQTLLVVEAAAHSGTLSTAAFARRLRRTVLVSPPGVGVQRAGIAKLVQEGHAAYALHTAPPAAGPMWQQKLF
jgi:DNA processing protein